MTVNDNKIEVSELIRIYSQIDLEDQRFDLQDNDYFRMYFEGLLNEIIKKEYGVDDYFSEIGILFNRGKIKTIIQRDKGIRKEIRKILKENFRNKGGVVKNPDIVNSFYPLFLNEAVSCLDNCLYWFLIYKSTCSRYTEKCGVQAIYYSEFFAMLSIARFLGLAHTHIKKIGMGFRLRHLKSNADPASYYLQIELTQGVSHVNKFRALKEFIETYIDLSPYPNLNALFGDPRFKPLLKENREDYVYNISDRRNYPWHFSYSIGTAINNEREEYCFLAGTGYLMRNIKTTIHNQEDFDNYFEEFYGNWGYEEHHIGILIKWIIDRFHEIGLNHYLNRLDYILQNYLGETKPKAIQDCINILHEWLNP